MATGFIDIMKRTALNTINNAQLTDIRHGTVVSVNPLKIKLTEQLTLPNKVLIVPQHLTNHSMSVTIDGVVKTVVFNNALRIGDKVALLRKQGGQSYYILDRI